MGNLGVDRQGVAVAGKADHQQVAGVRVGQRGVGGVGRFGGRYDFVRGADVEMGFVPLAVGRYQSAGVGPNPAARPAAYFRPASGRGRVAARRPFPNFR